MSTLDPPFPELANRTHISSSWAEFENMTKYDVLEKVNDHVYSLDVLFKAHVTLFQRTHVKLFGSLDIKEMDWAKELNTSWYRSKQPVMNTSFVSGVPWSNKKWPLNEGSQSLQCLNNQCLVLFK